MSLTGLPSKRFRILIVGGGLSEYWSLSHFLFKINSSAGGLALANGLLNAAGTAALDVVVFEKDTDEYLSERGGYQIRVGCSRLLFGSSFSFHLSCSSLRTAFLDLRSVSMMRRTLN